MPRRRPEPLSLAIATISLSVIATLVVEPTTILCTGPTNLLPEPGSETAHPRAMIQFVNRPCGTPFSSSESPIHFTLFEVSDALSKRTVVPSAPSTVGDITVIKPLESLKIGSRYRLESSDSPAPVLDFRVGNAYDLPEPEAEPAIKGVFQGEASHEYHFVSFGGSHSVVVHFESAGIDPSMASLFFWELLYRSEGGWIPLQRTSTHLSISSFDAASGSPTGSRWTETLVIHVGSNSLAYGPVFPEGIHDIRLDLVRADGRRWSTPVQTIVVTYWYHKTPCKGGMSPGELAGVYKHACTGPIGCDTITLNPDGSFVITGESLWKIHGLWSIKEDSRIVLSPQEHSSKAIDPFLGTITIEETLYYYDRCTLYPVLNEEPLRLGGPYGKVDSGT